MSSLHFGQLEVTVRATIRSCREEDLPALEWMGLYSRDREIIRQAFDEQQRGDALMLLAVAADFPIAQVWMRFGRRGRRQVAALWAVRTFYPLQGAGIGRRMMRAAERVMARRGVEQAELEVDNCNREVLDFYRALGWSVEDGRPDKRGDVDGGRLLLAKEIVPA